jgi:hypothetical protein
MGIFLEMKMAQIDRNIRIEVFQILQLEIEGIEGSDGWPISNAESPRKLR